MPKKLQIIVAGFLAVLCNIPAVAHVLTVYGLEQGSRLKESNHSGVSYVLQAGSFQNKENALHYCNLLAQKIQRNSVHITSTTSAQGKRYTVTIGPFTQAKQLKVLSQALLSQQPQTVATPSNLARTVPKPINVSSKQVKAASSSSVSPMQPTQARVTKTPVQVASLPLIQSYIAAETSANQQNNKDVEPINPFHMKIRF